MMRWAFAIAVLLAVVVVGCGRPTSTDSVANSQPKSDGPSASKQALVSPVAEIPAKLGGDAAGWMISTPTLITKNWIVTIVDVSPEGTVVNEVTYCGVSKKTGKSICLQGSTWHTHSADGTPGRYLGWIFKNGDVTYQVIDEGESGILRVFQGDSRVLVDEAGAWHGRD